MSLSVRDRPHISELEACRLIKQKLTPSVYQLQPRRSRKFRINKMSSIHLDYFRRHMIVLLICAWWHFSFTPAAPDIVNIATATRWPPRCVGNSSASPGELAEMQSQGWRPGRREAFLFPFISPSQSSKWRMSQNLHHQSVVEPEKGTQWKVKRHPGVLGYYHHLCPSISVNDFDLNGMAERPRAPTRVTSTSLNADVSFMFPFKTPLGRLSKGSDSTLCQEIPACVWGRWVKSNQTRPSFAVPSSALQACTWPSL